MNVWEGVDPFKEARDFCQLWGIEGPVLVDADGTFVAELGIRGVPTNVLVDEDGTVTCVGASTPPALEAAVRRLLGPDVLLEAAADADSWSWDKDQGHIEAHLAKRIVRPSAETETDPDGPAPPGPAANGHGHAPGDPVMNGQPASEGEAAAG